MEVSDRGAKAALAYFNVGRFQSDPGTEANFGDGLLMRRGLTIIGVGWQFDVPRLSGRLRLHVPIVKDGERIIEGLVRADWVVDQPTKRLAIGHRNHIAYDVASPDHPDNRLTVRDGRLAPRQLVPRSDWRFVESTHIEMPVALRPPFTTRAFCLLWRASRRASVRGCERNFRRFHSLKAKTASPPMRQPSTNLPPYKHLQPLGPVKRKIRSVHPVTVAQLVRPAPWDLTIGASSRDKPGLLPTPPAAYDFAL